MTAVAEDTTVVPPTVSPVRNVAFAVVGAATEVFRRSKDCSTVEILHQLVEALDRRGVTSVVDVEQECIDVDGVLLVQLVENLEDVSHLSTLMSIYGRTAALAVLFDSTKTQPDFRSLTCI